MCLAESNLLLRGGRDSVAAHEDEQATLSRLLRELSEHGGVGQGAQLGGHYQLRRVDGQILQYALVVEEEAYRVEAIKCQEVKVPTDRVFIQAGGRPVAALAPPPVDALDVERLAIGVDFAVLRDKVDRIGRLVLPFRKEGGVDARVGDEDARARIGRRRRRVAGR